jgi:integrase
MAEREAPTPLEITDPFTLVGRPARPDAPSLLADIERFIEAARLLELERRGMGSPATLRAYRSDWASFCAWCATKDRVPLPALPITVAQYLRYLIDRPKEVVTDEYRLAGREQEVKRRRSIGPAHAKTVARHLVSIRKAHLLRGFADPTDDENVKLLFKGIRAERGVKPKRQKAAVDREKLLVGIDALDAEHAKAIAEAQQFERTRAERSAVLHRARDRAILLCGWSGALRRSEIARVDVEHLQLEQRGLQIVLPFSKTNQEGEHEYVLIGYAGDERYCPVRAILEWQEISDAREGALFRQIDRHGRLGDRIRPKVVADIVQRAMMLGGFDERRPTGEDRIIPPSLFGAHSLRAGWITTAAIAGRREEAIMKHSRHKNAVVMRGYIRRATKWDGHAGEGLL